jgi:hypothetical protein
MSPLANILAGAFILFFGRRLYWVFVAVVGFVAGAQLAANFLSAQPSWVILAAGAALGLLGAIASLFLQKLVIIISGLVCGAYLGFVAFNTGRIAIPEWAAVAIGGVVGLLLVALLFNWALVLLSSLTGASVIASNISMKDPHVTEILFYVLLVLGLIVQSRQMFAKPEKKSESGNAK